MESERFDALTRRLTAPDSRRGALRLLMSAAFGALGAPLAAESTKAKNNKKKGNTNKAKNKNKNKNKNDKPQERCKGNQQRCNGECYEPCEPRRQRNARTCQCECPRTSCPIGKLYNFEHCECQCAGGLHECEDGTCIGLDRCCPEQRQCRSGACLPKNACCSDEWTCQNGSCLLKEDGECCAEDEECGTDPEGCCNTFAGERCSDDGCCNVLLGFEVCNGKCVDTDNDVNNCGACGAKCGCGATCVRGQCVGGKTCSRCQRCQDGDCVDACELGECCGSGDDAKCCVAGTCCVGVPGSRTPVACCEGTAGCCGRGGDGSASCSPNFCPDATSNTTAAQSIMPTASRRRSRKRKRS